MPIKTHTVTRFFGSTPHNNPFKIPTFWHDEIPIVFSAVDIVDSLWN